MARPHTGHMREMTGMDPDIVFQTFMLAVFAAVIILPSADTRVPPGSASPGTLAP